jgi:hypothetical protein
VVHFVLYADGEEALRGPLDRFAALIPGPDRDPGCPSDFVVITRDGQTALLALRLALGCDDFRVDEDEQVVFRLGDVDDDDPLVHVHLRRGEPDARGGVHRFGHVADEFDHLGGERRDGGRDFFETRIGVFEDRKKRHSLPNARLRMQNPC